MSWMRHVIGDLFKFTQYHEDFDCSTRKLPCIQTCRKNVSISMHHIHARYVPTQIWTPSFVDSMCRVNNVNGIPTCIMVFGQCVVSYLCRTEIYLACLPHYEDDVTMILICTWTNTSLPFDAKDCECRNWLLPPDWLLTFDYNALWIAYFTDNPISSILLVFI